MQAYAHVFGSDQIIHFSLEEILSRNTALSVVVAVLRSNWGYQEKNSFCPSFVCSILLVLTNFMILPSYYFYHPCHHYPFLSFYYVPGIVIRDQ